MLASESCSVFLTSFYTLHLLFLLACSFEPAKAAEEKDKLDNMYCRINSKDFAFSLKAAESAQARQLLSHLLSLKDVKRVGPLKGEPEHTLYFYSPGADQYSYAVRYTEAGRYCEIFSPIAQGPFQADDELHDRIMKVIRHYVEKKRKAKD